MLNPKTSKIMKAHPAQLTSSEMKNILGAPYGYFDKKCKCFIVIQW